MTIYINSITTKYVLQKVAHTEEVNVYKTKAGSIKTFEAINYNKISKKH